MNASLLFHVALGHSLLAASAVLPDIIKNPPIIINETISMAKGAYVRTGKLDDLKRGDIIAMPMNASAKAYLGAKLGYPEDTMLIKRVVGLSGDIICRHGTVVTIDAQVVTASLKDAKGHELPAWRGCHMLLPSEVFLIGDHASSFDSRYFGPVSRQELSGTYKAVMTW